MEQDRDKNLTTTQAMANRTFNLPKTLRGGLQTLGANEPVPEDSVMSRTNMNFRLNNKSCFMSTNRFGTSEAAFKSVELSKKEKGNPIST